MIYSKFKKFCFNTLKIVSSKYFSPLRTTVIIENVGHSFLNLPDNLKPHSDNLFSLGLVDKVSLKEKLSKYCIAKKFEKLN